MTRVNLQDLLGQEIGLQHSSLAGETAFWIFLKMRGDLNKPDNDLELSLQINVEQAKIIINALQLLLKQAKEDSE